MRKHLYTILGLLAILFWSTTIGFSRGLAEKLGVITSGAAIFFVSGIISTATIYWKKSNREKLLSINRKYLFGCGSLFLFYTISLYISVGSVQTRQQVLEIGLLNYLWPSLTILFSVLIFKFTARIWLLPGLILATLGVYVAALQGSDFLFSQLSMNIINEWPVYLLALIAAILWGLYSNFTKLWGSEKDINGMPIFILVTGIVLIILRLFVNENSIWDSESISGVLYMAVFPTFLGYQFWDKAMQKGDIILVGSFSYFTPILATLFSCIFLKLTCGWIIWLACGLVLVGSVITKISVKSSNITRL